MDIINNFFDKDIKFNTYVALGNFDGIHIGHKKLIEKILQLAKDNASRSMVFTFENHPLSIIDKNKMPKLLTSNDQKIKVLSECNIDILSLIHFDTKLMKMSPEDFIIKLVKFFNIKGIIVGFNYRFGYKNIGNIDLLKRLSKQLNFELFVIDSVEFNDQVVSSSTIRNLISDGQIEKANIFLGRPYCLEGKVINGKKIGRTLGIPTANLEYNSDYVVPKRGVYYTNIVYNNKLYKGITNVGFNPTVNGEKLSIETNILDFDKNIYGENLNIYFIERIRSEKKFNSLDNLKEQLLKDKNYVSKKNLNI